MKPITLGFDEFIVFFLPLWYFVVWLFVSWYFIRMSCILSSMNVY